MNKLKTYLALGDSYTIGEAVPLVKSFPYQFVDLLRKEKPLFAAPEIIAKTGWTTDELLAAMATYTFLDSYDLVSLLIGVNNQYRGRTAEEYKLEFEQLLTKAISLADNKKEHVIVLSIPDYSVTPFSNNLDREKIARDIELFNSINKAVSIQYNVTYIAITESTKQAQNDPSLVAEDGLHPSEKEYAKWAEKMAAVVLSDRKK